MGRPVEIICELPMGDDCLVQVWRNDYGYAVGGWDNEFDLPIPAPTMIFPTLERAVAYAKHESELAAKCA